MLKDRFGTEITVGCTVAYPGRCGSSCWISTGRVVKIDPGGKEWPDPSWRARLLLEGGGHAPGEAMGRRWVGMNSPQMIVVG